MQVPDSNSLRTAYERYGPRTDRHDVGAGYAAAVGAVAVAALYVASVWLVTADHLGVESSPYFAELEFRWVVYAATRGLVVVVPAAFFVGLAGWQLTAPATPLRAVLAGGVGAVATYLVAFVPTVAVLSVVATAGGAAPIVAGFDAVAVAGLSVGAAFLLTWWLAVPVGCLVGLAYVTGRPATA